jgi:hypothetical protein
VRAAARDQRGSLVNVADPREVSRLVRGFFGRDNPYWRWVGRESSIILNPPKDANKRGAMLVIHFAIVEAVLASVKTQELSIAVDGFALPPRHYDHPGQFTLMQDVPAAALQFDPVRVDFTLDRALPPAREGEPEFGMIVSQAGLAVK